MPERENILSNLITTDPKILDFLKENNYADAANTLLTSQKINWRQLSEGYKSLDDIKVKSIQFDGYVIKVQYNPKRLVSSSAKVDTKSIKERRCFLCKENLPEEQKGILFDNEYIILCNPFPIFPEHFTISYHQHIPQRIKNSFGSLLSLTKALSKRYIVFYNGPECGASAPDHLHFQAATKNFMPIDSEFNLLKSRYGRILFENNDLILSSINDGLRIIISFESKKSRILKKVFDNFYSISSAVSKSQIEPMMNILTSYEDEFGWRILAFLREKHRPSFYFSEGETNFLWSPAAVDLGGICIIPLEKDFNKASKDLIRKGFNEITASNENISFIEMKLKENAVNLK